MLLFFPKRLPAENLQVSLKECCCTLKMFADFISRLYVN